MDRKLIFVIKGVDQALTAQESILLTRDVTPLQVKCEHFPDALEQRVQCRLKAFTEKQWVLGPAGRSTGKVEILPFGQGGQTAVAEGWAWK